MSGRGPSVDWEEDSLAEARDAATALLITVAGSTGTIGSELVRLLSAAGVATRALHRDVRKTRALPNVTWVRADLDDTRGLRVALDATQRLFLLTGNQPDFALTQSGVIRTAEELGVKHVVKLSALGASDHSRSTIGREHWAVEQALLGTRLHWTILRPHAFMQNWLGDVAEEARARLAARGIAAAAIEPILAIAAYQRAGGPTATISPHVEQLLGRRPRTIRDFARDYASRFV